MPGIAGFAGEYPPQMGRLLLASMLDFLKLKDWYLTDAQSNDLFGLGRTTLGIINPEPQPIWNADHTCCVVMEGELFDQQVLKKKLIEKGVVFNSRSDGELLLHLFEEYGEEFSILLNGAFVAAIWDDRNQTLYLLTDRIGQYPLYYFSYSGNLIFSSKVGALLADQNIPRQIDPVSVAQLVTFDHLIGHRTLLEGIRLLPPATILKFHNGNITSREYWKFSFPSSYSLLSEDDYVEGLLFYLRQAISRQAPGEFPSGVMLSGGLDSRVVLAALWERIEKKDFLTFTYGIRNSSDVRYAKELTSRLNIPHHHYDISPDYLMDVAQEGIRITDGQFNLVHMIALAAAPIQSQHAKIIYKGTMGDALTGYGLTRMHWASISPETLIQLHYHVHLAQQLIVFPFEEDEALFTPQILSQIDEPLRQSYLDMFLQSETSSAADQRLYFDIRQRVPRMAFNGVELARSHTIVRTPFCDNDLIDYLQTFPPGLRFERYLIKKAFIKAFPELAKIPYTETHMPLVPCMRDLTIRMNQQMYWFLKNHGVNWISLPPPRGFTDYPKWMRTNLRQWVEDILLDPQCLSRGFFQPDYIRKLVSEHMQGANHAKKLGVLLAFELWNKQISSSFNQ